MTVQYLSLKKETPKNDYWDYGLTNELLKEFESVEVDSITAGDFAIVIIPARHHADMVNEINKELSKLESVLLMLLGDEEGDFPIDQIKHKNIRTWIQNPKPGIDDKYRRLGCGYPPKISECKDLPDKKINWSYSGQVTHERREKCVEKLEELGDGVLNKTEGFTQGYPQAEYFKMMSESKVCPCPSGPQTPDTFRLFEALELGCIPIADNETPKKDWSGFWQWLFDEPVPFPTINDYDDLPGYIGDLVGQYPYANNRVQAWWMRYKSKLRNKIYSDIKELTGKDVGSNCTVVIPISPIPSHPETHILEETISSIRYHLPDSEIILSFDGVRKEQEEMRTKYEEHIRRVLWKARSWGKVTPFIFNEHKHQSGMMKKVLEHIKTPLILYAESDCPLVTDEPIEWDLLQDAILSGESNVIRLHHEGQIPRAHRHMMLSKPEGKLQKTSQWSQRPSLASTAFYRRIINEHFSMKSRCFLEDNLHGKLHQACLIDGEMGWDQWRVHIYIPNDKNIKRSYD